MCKNFYAHSVKDRPETEWQRLEEHLCNVAEMAGSFAARFGAGDWGYLAGLWHDLGKYSAEYQDYIRQVTLDDEPQQRGPDHSTAGAQNAVTILGNPGKLPAYCLAGHHTGLPNGADNRESSLNRRLQKTVCHIAPPESIIQRPALPKLPLQFDGSRTGFQISFFIRMLFSALTDADFLDTEAFLDPDKANWRKGYPDIGTLAKRLESFMTVLLKNAQPTGVNRIRRQVYEACIRKADNDPGLFSMTVPTGGGKTLSSLAFGLNHAQKHGLDRIIYVIPFTSIIEQNAAVFREVLGTESVVEHHSAFAHSKEESGEELHGFEKRAELAAENWDAPIVVTTNVQFFESLFASRTSKCRKLHNVARSVIILDEAQMLPPALLLPCLEVLRELTKNYGSSIVLCTATQPALSYNDLFPEGLQVQEIAPQPHNLHLALKRTQVSQAGKLDDSQLAKKITDHEQVLCIVNSRRHARKLYEAVADAPGARHLSALMCPAHRSQVIAAIKTGLQSGDPCRVISTSLIEAGVDLDFPCVYRATAGLDSIAQSAGRCNREGRLGHLGEVFIFDSEDRRPFGFLNRMAQIGAGVLSRHDDPLSPKAVTEYFKQLFWLEGNDLDAEGILPLLEEKQGQLEFPFRDVAALFKLIKSDMQPVIVPYDDEACRVIEGLRHAEHLGRLARQAQRYSVQIYPHEFENLERSGLLYTVKDQFHVLDMQTYDEHLGVMIDKEASFLPENLIL